MPPKLEKDLVATQKISGSQKFIHPPLGETVEFFGGRYFFLEEGRLTFHGKEVLYLLGVAVMESSCCGRGGWAFIKVPGYIRTWKREVTTSGQYLSEVELISFAAEQKEITSILKEKYPECAQVNFI